MSDHFWLSEDQIVRIEPFFPLSHGVPRVDDRKVVSGIIHMIPNGLRWRDAPAVWPIVSHADMPRVACDGV